jgi:hypothetical protein
MKFGDPLVREAYRRGARDSYESAFMNLPAPDALAIKEWLTTLDA